MAHINGIGAGFFSDLSVSAPATTYPTDVLNTLNTGAEFQSLFASAIESVAGVKAGSASQTGGAVTASGGPTFIRILGVRSFPAIGTPPNVVNVPGFGSKTSKQIQGQSDAPSMEITMNYVPTEWASDSLLGAMVGDGVQRVFRFTLLNEEPTGTDATKYASTAGGLGTQKNTQYYFIGKIDALMVSPQLSDANTATITITIQSAMFGAFTI